MPQTTAEMLRAHLESVAEDCQTEQDADQLLADDPLEIDFRENKRGEYKSGEVLITYGGPNIWIDTSTDCLHGAWGSTTDTITLPYRFIRALDSRLQEYHACTV